MQRQVLESVVEQMNGRAEAFLGKAAREVPILCDQNRDIRETSREHERFVAGLPNIGLDHSMLTHDHDTVDRVNPTIPATEQCRALTHRHENRRHIGRDRRLPAPAHRERPDTHHRSTKAAAHLGPRLVPPSPSLRKRSVDPTQHGITLRNGPKRPYVALEIWSTWRKNVGDDLEGLESGALVRVNERPGSRAETGASDRVAEQHAEGIRKRGG